jgi:hypothetical protein
MVAGKMGLSPSAVGKLFFGQDLSLAEREIKTHHPNPPDSPCPADNDIDRKKRRPMDL